MPENLFLEQDLKVVRAWLEDGGYKTTEVGEPKYQVRRLLNAYESMKSEKHLTIKELCLKSHALAVEKGWWESGERNMGELLCLIHSEVSEALESWRNGEEPLFVKPDKQGVPKPEGLLIELADVLIRIADLCQKKKWDLESALEVKLDYNRTRPHRHGGKKA
jgi:NTP pyrophosphatase (non-canonical NTP hydrolase)